MDDQAPTATALHAMALLAAARAAFGTARQIAGRRSGQDPTEQEPEGTVRADLASLREDVGELVTRLRLRAAIGMPEAPAAVLTQSFEDRLLLHELGRTTRQIHQKLLSLYPAVHEDVVEEARLLAAEADEVASGDDLTPHLEALGRRAATWLDALVLALL